MMAAAGAGAGAGAGAPQQKRLRRAFSPQRFFGGILVFILTAAMIAGCTYSAGRGGIYFLIIAIPMFGMGGALVAKPFQFICNSCNTKVKKPLKSVPLSSNAMGHAHGIAMGGDPAHLDYLFRNAPLPDSVAGYIAMGARTCDCGQAGFISLSSYKAEGGKGKPLPDKTLVEFGAEIGPDQIRMFNEAGPARWQATQQQRGFDDPFPKG